MNIPLDNLICTDNELAALSSQNQEYFSVLIERYEQKLGRYIKRITNVSKEDQEDILQNIFIKTYMNLNGFDTTLSFNSWIYRIAHNEIIDWARKQKNQEKHGKYDYDDEIFSWTEDTQHFLKALDISEGRLEVQNIFKKMEPRYREVLVLKFLEGYSYREMSDILKKPEGTIATLINRAKKAFKQQYE
jgi:RNA polymerase sigma-70 factor (ECF subfamily)